MPEKTTERSEGEATQWFGLLVISFVLITTQLLQQSTRKYKQVCGTKYNYRSSGDLSSGFLSKAYIQQLFNELRRVLFCKVVLFMQKLHYRQSHLACRKRWP